MTVQYPEDPRLIAIQPQPSQDEPTDAGIVAAERVRTRGLAYKAKRAFKLMCVIITILIVVTIASTAWVLYKYHTAGSITESRSCAWQAGALVIQGTRSSTYGYQEYLGFIRIFDATQVVDRTVIILDGSAMTIIGTTTDKWWAENVGAGDRGQFIMKPAKSYTFVSGKNVGVVEYNSFCNKG